MWNVWRTASFGTGPRSPCPTAPLPSRVEGPLAAVRGAVLVERGQPPVLGRAGLDGEQLLAGAALQLVPDVHQRRDARLVVGGDRPLPADRFDRLVHQRLQRGGDGRAGERGDERPGEDRGQDAPPPAARRPADHGPAPLAERRVLEHEEHHRGDAEQDRAGESALVAAEAPHPCLDHDGGGEGADGSVEVEGEVVGDARHRPHRDGEEQHRPEGGGQRDHVVHDDVPAVRELMRESGRRPELERAEVHDQAAGAEQRGGRAGAGEAARHPADQVGEQRRAEQRPDVRGGREDPAERRARRTRSARRARPRLEVLEMPSAA